MTNEVFLMLRVVGIILLCCLVVEMIVTHDKLICYTLEIEQRKVFLLVEKCTLVIIVSIILLTVGYLMYHIFI